MPLGLPSYNPGAVSPNLNKMHTPEDKNFEFYIKYQNNNPIPVQTHFIGEQERRRPLSTVAHLLAAFFPSAEPEDLGQFNVHYFVDGIVGPAIPINTSLASIQEPNWLY